MLLIILIMILIIMITFLYCSLVLAKYADQELGNDINNSQT